MSRDRHAEAEDAKLPATLVVTELTVTGMCCQSEVALIRKKIGTLDGVVDLKFNLMLRRCTVTHEERVTHAQLLRPLNWAALGASVVERGKSGAGINRGSLCSAATLVALLSLVLFGLSNGIWARPEGTEWWDDVFSYVALANVLLGLPTLFGRALIGLRQGRLNMFATMAIACTGALVLLDLWEASAVVFFYLASEWLQMWCVHHTAAASDSLGGMLPELAHPADGGPAKPLSEVAVGELLLVKPGQAVPVDGEVVDGSSAIDESMLTGEAVPVAKQVGSGVFAGTTNQSGVITIRVARLPNDTSAAQLSTLVSEAQGASGRQLMLERFANVYTTTVLLAALLLATVPLGLCSWQEGGGGAHSTWTSRWMHADDGTASCVWWLRRALALVVISCPCALIVAMPVTNACGISAVAKWGILVKSSRQLELLARMSTLALDKTGTLTEGRFRLRQVTTNEANPHATLTAVMECAAAVEKNSSHPIAAAFLEYAVELGVDPPPAPHFTLLEGEGIEAVVDGATVHVGNERLVRRLLAEAAKANQELASTPAVEAAAEAFARARAAVAHAVKEEMPVRMIRSLEKKQAAALEALDAAKAEASRALPSPPPSPPPSPLGGGGCGTGCCGGGCGEGGTTPPLTLDSELVAQWQRAGCSVLWVVLDGQIAAACQLSDEIRGEAAVTMRHLASLGVTTTMLTGDCEETAQAVRAQAGIGIAVAGMKPAEKLEHIRGFGQQAVVGMVGDGINDGPALAAADVGIAMGVGGTAMASAAAGVVLMSIDLRRICDAIYVARLTSRTLRASVAATLLLKIVPLVLIFALADAEGYLIAAAVGSDVLGLIIVLAAAMQLLRVQPKYAAEPCANNDSALEGPTIVTSSTIDVKQI